MQQHLLDQIRNFFSLHYNGIPEIMIAAPGRINLIGEHTDYNNGLVFPAAIDKYMYFGFRKNKSNTIRIATLNLNQSVVLKINKITRSNHSWANYLIGNLLELKQNNIIEGFDCAFISDIPMGSGMSSSSAMECGFLKGINTLFSLNLSSWKLIDISQRSNHQFLGIKGGILDQFACLFGKEKQSMLMDCQDRIFSYFPTDLENYKWVLFNSMITHDHETSAYNERVTACQTVVSKAMSTFEKITSLRDLSIDQLEEIKPQLSSFENSCATYILKENKRVLQFGAALKTQNISKIGELLYESHHGLQYQYQVSCQELDILVNATRDMDDVAGARMMGGGFGGCTLNLIASSNMDEVVGNIMQNYFLQTGIHASVYFVNIVDGCTAF